MAIGCALLAQSYACSGEDVVLGGGRLRADAAPDAPDAARDGAPGEPDARVARPPFSAPVAIAELAQAEATDDDPSLSEDLTLLYFNSERAGGAGQEDIWFTTRDSPAQPWRPPEPVTELNTDVRETGIALAPDGLAVWWSSDREGGQGGLDVYTAARTSRSAAWSAPALVPELNSEGDDLVSAVSDGERTVLLARRASDDDDYDLFVAHRNDRASLWGAPTAITELNSDEGESDAFLVDGGLTLLFTRDEDLHFAERSAPGAAFAVPVAIEELNSEQDDRDAWASPDLAYIVFSSDRMGSYALYEATR
jgi:hypothetical protein